MINQVLVIDDESIVRDVLKNMLEILGYEAVAVPSGETALETLEEDGASFDLVLVDMHMPGLSGPETVGRIREKLPEIPILLVSGVEEGDLAELYQGHLIDGFVHKPFRMVNLKESIEKVSSMVVARMKRTAAAGARNS
jgi:CheY-like chemotaxis protein